MKKRIYKILTGTLVCSMLLVGCSSKKSEKNPTLPTTAATQKSLEQTTSESSVTNTFEVITTTQAVTTKTASQVTTTKATTQATTTKPTSQAATTKSTTQAATTKPTSQNSDELTLEMLLQRIFDETSVYNVTAATYVEVIDTSLGHYSNNTFFTYQADKDGESFLSVFMDNTYYDIGDSGSGKFMEVYQVKENGQYCTYGWNALTNAWSIQPSDTIANSPVSASDTTSIDNLDDIINPKLEIKTNEYVITGMIPYKKKNNSDENTSTVLPADMHFECHFDKSGNITSVSTWADPGVYEDITCIEYKSVTTFNSTKELDVVCPDEVKASITTE